LSDSKSELQL
jgi:hypothetical protein